MHSRSSCSYIVNVYPKVTKSGTRRATLNYKVIVQILSKIFAIFFSYLLNDPKNRVLSKFVFIPLNLVMLIFQFCHTCNIQCNANTIGQMVMTVRPYATPIQIDSLKFTNYFILVLKFLVE